MDGAFCEFSEIEKLEYLERLQKNGVVNIEMECSAFAALTYHAGIKSAIVCVTYLDRLKHDQVRDVHSPTKWKSGDAVPATLRRFLKCR